MSETDWNVLLRWNQDPRVLLAWNDGDTAPWKLPELQAIYRAISKHAHMFVVEQDGNPIGECWLQRMNLEEILRARPRETAFRIDLSLGKPTYWGRGYGTEIVRSLTEFGFASRDADTIFACHVRDSNIASRRVFEKNGFVEWGPAAPDGLPGPSDVRRHLYLPRARWQAARDRSDRTDPRPGS